MSETLNSDQVVKNFVAEFKKSPTAYHQAVVDCATKVAAAWIKGPESEHRSQMVSWYLYDVIVFFETGECIEKPTR